MADNRITKKELLDCGLKLDSDTDSEIEIEFDMDFDQCSHQGSIVNGFCTDCNVQVDARTHSTRISNRANSKTPKILAYMNQYAFDEQTKSIACQLFHTLNLSNQREPALKQALCYCIFRAHVVRGVHTVPYLIGDVMGLTKSQVSRAMSRYHGRIDDVSGSFDGYIDPVNLIPQYAHQFNFASDIIDDMQAVFRNLITRFPDLENRPACTLVAAFMWYYSTTSGIKIDETSFANVFKLKFATIKSVATEITRIDNDH